MIYATGRSLIFLSVIQKVLDITRDPGKSVLILFGPLSSQSLSQQVAHIVNPSYTEPAQSSYTTLMHFIMEVYE